MIRCMDDWSFVSIGDVLTELEAPLQVGGFLPVKMLNVSLGLLCITRWMWLALFVSLVLWSTTLERKVCHGVIYVIRMTLLGDW